MNHLKNSRRQGLTTLNPAQDPVFNVGKSDPAKDWYAYQPGSGNGRAGFRPHPFTVKFDLSTAPQGVFSLKVGLLAYMARLPRLQIEINGHRGCSTYTQNSTMPGGIQTRSSYPSILTGRLPRSFPHSISSRNEQLGVDRRR